MHKLKHSQSDKKADTQELSRWDNAGVSTQRRLGKMEAWEKLTAPQLKEAIEMFRTERDLDNEHLTFDEYQRVVDVHALAEWIEWEYTEVLMNRQQWENTMRAEAEYEAKLDKKYNQKRL